MIAIKSAAVTQMANESNDFEPFISEINNVLDRLGAGTIYLVVERVSKDSTLELCDDLLKKDARDKTVCRVNKFKEGHNFFLFY
jgi:dolichol-phosphate mannosyltransferase